MDDVSKFIKEKVSWLVLACIAVNVVLVGWYMLSPRVGEALHPVANTATGALSESQTGKQTVRTGDHHLLSDLSCCVVSIGRPIRPRQSESDARNLERPCE